MAQLRFSEEDERLIESLMEEFKPTKRMEHLAIREMVPGSVWDGLLNYQRARTLHAIRIAIAANAVGQVFGGSARDLLQVVFTMDDEFGPDIEDAGYPSRGWSDGLPSEVTREFEDQIFDLEREPMLRVLGVEFEPTVRED